MIPGRGVLLENLLGSRGFLLKGFINDPRQRIEGEAIRGDTKKD